MKRGCSEHIFEKILKYQISWKSVKGGLFHADGWTDGETKKLVVAFLNFAKAPKSELWKNKYVIGELIVAQLVSKFPTE